MFNVQHHCYTLTNRWAHSDTMKSTFTHRRRSTHDDSLSGYEFITHEGLISGSEDMVISRSAHSPTKAAPVRSFEELTAAVYPPNPTYDISEKPWLPGLQKPYLLLNANLVDPRSGVVHKGTSLHLAGGKIVKVAPTTSHDLNAEFTCAGQTVEKIDASQYFVCPGLIDCEFLRMPRA